MQNWSLHTMNTSKTVYPVFPAQSPPLCNYFPRYDWFCIQENYNLLVCSFWRVYSHPLQHSGCVSHSTLLPTTVFQRHNGFRLLLFVAHAVGIGALMFAETVQYQLVSSTPNPEISCSFSDQNCELQLHPVIKITDLNNKHLALWSKEISFKQFIIHFTLRVLLMCHWQMGKMLSQNKVWVILVSRGRRNYL